MRDIKFRFYSNLDKKMYESTLIDTSEGNDSAIFDGADVKMKDGSIRCQRRSEGHLMQYTGLKDKNGVEIYEGDICKYGYGNFFSNAEVKYFTKYTSFGLDESQGTVNPRKQITEKTIKDSNIEVIGNIYENPELLTNK